MLLSSQHFGQQRQPSRRKVLTEMQMHRFVQQHQQQLLAGYGGGTFYSKHGLPSVKEQGETAEGSTGDDDYIPSQPHELDLANPYNFAFHHTWPHGVDPMLNQFSPAAP